MTDFRIRTIISIQYATEQVSGVGTVTCVMDIQMPFQSSRGYRTQPSSMFSKTDPDFTLQKKVTEDIGRLDDCRNGNEKFVYITYNDCGDREAVQDSDT